MHQAPTWNGAECRDRAGMGSLEDDYSNPGISPEKFGDFLEIRVEAPGGVTLERVRAIQTRAVRRPDGFAEVWIPIRELDPQGKRFEKIVFHAWRSVGPERVELDGVGLTGAPPLR